MKLKGSISVFISLLLVSILALSSAICEAVRFRGARISGICATDAAVESSLAKYDAELMDTFSVFGAYYQGMEEYKSSISEDIGRNLNPGTEMLFLKDTDFWKLQQGEIAFDEYYLLTDNNGELFVEQAISYVKANIPIKFAQFMTEYFNGNESPDAIEDYFQNEEKSTDELIESYEKQAEAEKDSDKSEVIEYEGEIIEVEESPVDVVKTIKKNGILSLIIPSDKELSGGEIKKENCLSNRNLNSGIHGEKTETDLLDKALYIEYLCDKLSNFDSSDNNTADLNYKLEYCIGGKSTDEDNLKYVVNRLLLIKEATNFAYLLTDAAKNAQALSVATGLVGATGIVPLVEAVKYAILLAWAYAESIVDVKNLLNGGSCALIKTAENWKLGVENIGDIQNCLTEPVEEANGFDYNTYLKLLMMFISTDELIIRSMDMVEQKMREIYKKETYCLDNLVVSVDVNINFSSVPLFLNFGFMKNYTYEPAFTVRSKYSYM